jgi:hypothetical protein
MKNLLKAISEIQQEVGTIKQVRVNTFAKFNYIDYTDVVLAVSKLLKDKGCTYIHSIENRTLTTQLYHIESGEVLESKSEIIEMESKGMNSYQVFGSGISYLKKYHLISLLGLATDEKSMDELQEERKPKAKPEIDSARFEKALESIAKGTYTVQQLKANFSLTKEQLSHVDTL